jgi:hypothetical protein
MITHTKKSPLHASLAATMQGGRTKTGLENIFTLAVQGA